MLIDIYLLGDLILLLYQILFKMVILKRNLMEMYNMFVNWLNKISVLGGMSMSV